MASILTRALEQLVRSYIPSKDQAQVIELVSHLIMLEPDPRDLRAMVNHQEAKYERRFHG